MLFYTFMLQLLYSGLFLWGANFRYFHGSPGCHEIFHPRKFPLALSTRAQIWTGDVLLWLFSLYLCLIDSVLDTQGPLSQAVSRVMAKEVNREL